MAGTVEKRYDHLLRLRSRSRWANRCSTPTTPTTSRRSGWWRSAATRERRVVSTTVGGVTETFGYNAFGELETQEAKYGATPLLRRDYTRDALGRITSVTEASWLSPCDDQLHLRRRRSPRRRALGASAVTYGYDPNGSTAPTSAACPVATYDARPAPDLRRCSPARTRRAATCGPKTDASGTDDVHVRPAGQPQARRPPDRRCPRSTSSTPRAAVSPASSMVPSPTSGSTRPAPPRRRARRRRQPRVGLSTPRRTRRAPDAILPRRVTYRVVRGPPRLATGDRQRDLQRGRPAHGLRRFSGATCSRIRTQGGSCLIFCGWFWDASSADSTWSERPPWLDVGVRKIHSGFGVLTRTHYGVTSHPTCRTAVTPQTLDSRTTACKRSKWCDLARVSAAATVFGRTPPDATVVCQPTEACLQRKCVSCPIRPPKMRNKGC